MAYVVRVTALFEEREHFLGLKVEVSITAADAAQAKELRKGNTCFGAVGVTGGKKKVRVRVSGFVVDRGGEES